MILFQRNDVPLGRYIFAGGSARMASAAVRANLTSTFIDTAVSLHAEQDLLASPVANALPSLTHHFLV